MSVLQERDWTAVSHSFSKSGPIRFAVIDEFLVDEVCSQLHIELASHWGWRQRSWKSPHLRNGCPRLQLIEDITDEVQQSLAEIMDGLSLVEHWALMYHRNEGGWAHADEARLTLNIWLTSDQYNLDASSGGMYLYDVTRPPEMPPHHALLPEWSEPYVRSCAKGSTYIPSRLNRAILFDSLHFHKSARLSFKIDDALHCRMNLTLLFDDEKHYRQRIVEHYGDLL